MGAGGLGGGPLSWDVSWFSALPPRCLVSAGREEVSRFVSPMARRPGS